MMSLWDALRMNMMISYQELVRTFLSVEEWKILLRDKKVFDDKSIAALKKWFIEPDHSCTCFDIGKKYDLHSMSAKEGANKRGNSSRLTQSFHFFMFEPIFSPVNALNQPI
ncbi:HNH endonuclease [Klebsiella pneumoniae]|nr:HNH endonuclease [Klebsiella pneumoniae]